MMSKKSQLKNYYEILEIPYDASIFDVQNAYQKLAAQWHPDKHKENRKAAEKKFHDLSEAYEVLSDRNSRSHYDQLLQKQFNLEDAERTFDDFYEEHGMVDEKEEEFFNKNYPDRILNYYHILGVPKSADFGQIREAYRKLALKYHPKNNPNDETAHKKFVLINEAYNNLSKQKRRETYDNWVYGEIEPYRAHDIFEDFFGNRVMEIPTEEEFFRPILAKKWSTQLDKLMNEDNWENVKDGEIVKTSTVFQRDNKGQTQKTVTTKKKIQNGKVKETKVEEYLYPNGTREITEIINNDGTVSTKKWSLAQGDERPKELCN